MSQHFLLSAAARTLSLSVVARMSEEEARQAFTSIRWADNQGKPYPDDALGEFRKWVREVYIPTRMPGYLGDKVKQGQIPPAAATAALAAFTPRKLISAKR